MVNGLATNVYHAVTGSYPAHDQKKKRESDMKIEHRTAEILDVRAEDDGTRKADLRVLTYDVVDSYKTRFKPGVFKRSTDSGQIPAVWSHDPTRPIGVVSDFRDDGKTLDGTLTFLPFEDVPDARMAYAAMKAGSIPGVSFGFRRSSDARADDDTDVRDIIEGDMIEISPVLNPAVPGSKTLAVRARLSDTAYVVPAATAADLITRFAAGMVDLQEALTELKEHRTEAEEAPEDEAEAEAVQDEEEVQATEESEEDEGEELPEDMVGPVADEDEVLGTLERAAGKPRTAAANGVYADPGLQKDGKKRYPLGNKDQVIAAWRYIAMPKNSKMYSSGQLATIKGKIRTAAKKYGVNISENDRKD